ncbi:(deoxy)nucleoside triphosphate pyrophosphohydrolase [Brochothrix campestris]|uniref:(deoxy)nucleoside triphosphate pyrophosphohydrolase n=1 Tax=Brochothrix campestris TaxID=2757 RepID=UPI0038CF9FA1
MKKNIYVVGAVIINDGKVLCAQRGETKTLARMWEFPGGKIENGETNEQALTREIKEEMHCEVVIGEHITTTTYEYEFGTVHLATYFAKIKTGTPLLTEHIQIKWLHPLEMDELQWAPADIPAVKIISETNIATLTFN